MNEKELNKILVDSKAESLIKNYETPFFIFFPKIMKKKIDQLNISLKKNYPNSQITYSVKTNYLPYVIKKAHSFGAYPECISGFEILICLKDISALQLRLGWRQLYFLQKRIIPQI